MPDTLIGVERIMINSADDWIRATTDPLDFCAECRMHLTHCECVYQQDANPCLYCGKAYPTFGLYPYCSAECSASAEADV